MIAGWDNQAVRGYSVAKSINLLGLENPNFHFLKPVGGFSFIDGLKETLVDWRGWSCACSKSINPSIHQSYTPTHLFTWPSISTSHTLRTWDQPISHFGEQGKRGEKARRSGAPFYRDRCLPTYLLVLERKTCNHSRKFSPFLFLSFWASSIETFPPSFLFDLDSNGSYSLIWVCEYFTDKFLRTRPHIPDGVDPLRYEVIETLVSVLVWLFVGSKS